MKINFKKIATVLGSAVLIGSTLGMAAAANYPQPFSEGAAIVYGSQGSLSDVAAAANIGSNLAVANTVSTVSGSTTTGGDSFKIEKTSTKFQYGMGINQIESTLDKKDLPTLLADGTYLDANNDEFEYKQTVALANLTLGLFDDDAYKRDTPTVGFSVPEGTNVLNYTLDFTDTVNWTNLQSTELPILGKKYYVLSTSSNTTLTLLDSAVSAEVKEGETKTLTVNDKSYEVSARITDGDSVKLTINGETTNTLDESQTQRLSDGAYVGIKDIAYSSKESGVSSVEFSIGSGKLKLVNGTDVELNEETIDNLGVTITSDSNNKLDTISLAWGAQEDSWITPTSSIEMPGFNAIKVAFAGMNYPKQEQIVVQADGDDNLVLSNFPLAGGVTETINLLYSNGTNFTLIGKDSNNVLATSGAGNGTLTFTKNADDYFVVTYLSGEDGSSYLVRATNWDDADYPTNTVDFEYLTSSGWKSLDTGVANTDSVTVGDGSFTASAISNESSSATVTVSAGTSTSFNKLISAEGLTVYLPFINTTAVSFVNATNYTAANACLIAVDAPTGVQLGYNQVVTYNGSTTGLAWTNTTTCSNLPSTYTLNFTEETKDDAIAGGSNFSVSVGLDSQSEVYITSVVGDGSAYEVGESDVYVSYVTSALNTEINDDQSGDHEKVTITYHGGESFADVFVTAPNAVVTPGTPGNSGVGAVVVKDSEVSTVQAKNLIVVGGSCVNTVAASLLGSTTPLCGADFTTKTGVGAGQFLIKVFASPYATGKVAMLVAGYNEGDTAKAATYLTTNVVSTDVGSEVKKTSATYADVA